MLRVSLLNVLVEDQDAAIGFYRDKLGFTLEEDLPFGPKRWVTMRAPGDKTVSLSLSLAESDKDRELVGRQGGSQPIMALETDDCLRDHKRMKELGVAFDGEPTVEPYGTGVVLQDLYGNRIYLNQAPR